MNKRNSTPMWARLKASEQRRKELELLLQQQEKRLFAEMNHFSRALALLEGYVAENTLLKNKLKKFQSLANEIDV
jgi:hypothetical protein